MKNLFYRTKTTEKSWKFHKIKFLPVKQFRRFVNHYKKTLIRRKPITNKKNDKNDPIFKEHYMGETVERPPFGWWDKLEDICRIHSASWPIWFLHAFVKLKLAAEITVQPIRRFPLDAAILFFWYFGSSTSDGNWFQNERISWTMVRYTNQNFRTNCKIFNSGTDENLKYVYDAIDITLQKLENEIPLIGFAGSPWTFFVIV